MSHIKSSRRIARIFTLLLSTCVLSVAAPAVSQASTHHHAQRAAGHTDPYTRSVVITTGW